LGRRVAIPRLRTRSDRRCMIAAGAITRLASEVRGEILIYASYQLVHTLIESSMTSLTSCGS